MYSTFNIPLSFKGACSKREHDGTPLYNSYYQWVTLYLVVSALMFYVPRALWLTMEGGLMKYLAKGTRGKIIEDADKKRDDLIMVFRQHLNNKYNIYAGWFFTFEQLNFVIVLLQWSITSKFLKLVGTKQIMIMLYIVQRSMLNTFISLGTHSCDMVPLWCSTTECLLTSDSHLWSTPCARLFPGSQHATTTGTAAAADKKCLTQFASSDST